MKIEPPSTADQVFFWSQDGIWELRGAEWVKLEPEPDRFERWKEMVRHGLWKLLRGDSEQ